MKKRVLSLAFIIAATLTASFITKANTKVFAVRFMDNVAPGACQLGSSLPSVCVAITLDEICQLVQGGLTRTWYQGTTCVIPYYKMP
ncbi:hypothetical protein F0L74_17965 [Chitinophaga agrisoli]|uniref:Uncharacterized protein n=1 Tax=Chitinophaga agrisoli TaxID=2607653 RepID=A0A5B2VTW3_9BACT|nr:hypothetical protein [Chitinophaga agrisoli]KAA2241752.1 hypothetical protein F0L74_17965 [Chitinophaga agrisoli]